MDLISKLEIEWAKNFPGDPLPSNILREKCHNYVSLQNAIRRCEQTIDNLNKKLQQEIFLRNFLENFTEKSLHAAESKNETDNALHTDFITSKQTSISTIGSLITETVSMSTMILKEDKTVSVEEDTLTNNYQTQSEQDNSVDGQISKNADIKVSISENFKKLACMNFECPIQVNDDHLTDENIPTNVNNQEHFKPKFKNKFGSYAEPTSSDLKLKTNQQIFSSLSSDSVYTHRKHSTNELQSTVASKKAIPPSLPPKPKKKHLSNVASCVLSNAKSNNNNNKHCSDNIKTNVSQNTSLNAAADPHEELGEQLSSNCFHTSVEVGNCLDFCANDVIVNVKAGLIKKSGAKPVKSSVKQVAANSLSVFKQQRGLTSTTGVDSATAVVPPNIVVKATGNSDNRNINFNDVWGYSCCNDIFQSTVEYKDLSTQEESGKRKSLDIAGYENKKPKPPVPTKKSIQSKNFEKSFQSENKFDCPNSSFQQQTVADECQKETEYQTKKINNKNEEEKESVEDRQLILNRKELSDEENVNNEEENIINKNIKAQSESTGDSSYHTTDDTDMSTFKKQKEDICFVSYRKLNTEFYESPFTNNSTLPMLERRSSLLKDDTISENLPQITKDAIFAQEQNLPPLPLARNSTFKTSGYGNKDDTKKELYENYDLQFGIQSKSVDSESDFSIDPSLIMTDTESPSIVKRVHSSSVILDVDQNVDTENTGVCQDADQKVVRDSCIEVKKNDVGHYKTCIELTDDDDDESDSSEKKMVKSVTSGNQQSISNSEDDSDEEIVSIIYENQQFDSLEDKNLLNMRKQAIRQFLATEEIFVETLENIQKLMDQLSATIDSKESFLSKTDFEIMFFKISEILSLHQTCVKQLAPKVQNWQNNETVGTILKELMVHFPVFEEYTKNYPSAVETIKKCSQVNGSFKKIAEEANFNPEMQKISLNVLLYKPISQLQFNTSFMQELLQYTPKSHADYEIIENTWRLTQHSLTGITNKNYDEKAENDQYLLKSDYLVELVGNVRKLRCFFLFNDVLVCTKQKFWQKGSFDVKWFIPISQLLLDKPSDNDEMKYHSTEAVDEIKRKISCLETEIRKVNDKDKLSDRAKEKLKKKISELQRELTRLSGYLEFILKHNKKAYTLLMSTDYAREEWKEALYGLKDKCVDTNFTGSEVQQLISNCKKLPNISSFLPHQQADKIEEHGLIGSLCVTLHELTGLDESCTTYCCLELDSWGQFFTKAHSVACNGAHPVWNEEFELELDYSHTLRILCYKKGKGNQGDILLGKSALALSKDWLSNFTRKPISMNKISLVISINHLPPNKAIQRIPSKVKTGTFGVDIQKIAHHQDRLFPAIISICTQEIEKRGLHEVGIYRVSGGQSDVKRLKLAFQKNTMKARKMIADPDFNIHAVAAVLKLFFRELPEPLFTNALHNKFLTVNDIYDAEIKKKKVIMLIHSLPDVNYHTLIHLLHHLQRISENSAINKMTNSNLAVIFGQSLMQPAPYSDQSSVEMASFLNAHLQNDVLEYIMNLQCSGVSLAKVY